MERKSGYLWKGCEKITTSTREIVQLVRYKVRILEEIISQKGVVGHGDQMETGGDY